MLLFAEDKANVTQLTEDVGKILKDFSGLATLKLENLIILEKTSSCSDWNGQKRLPSLVVNPI